MENIVNGCRDGDGYCCPALFLYGVWVMAKANGISLCGWLLTVPLQIIEFYLILAAVAVGAGHFGVTLLSVAMLVWVSVKLMPPARYSGEDS